MTSTSVDSKPHHAAAHARGRQDDFLLQVASLREAENSALAIVEEAKKQAAKVEADARERAVETAARASERAVGAKNEIIARGRQETDKEVGSMLSEAKRQAEKIRAKRLADRDVSAIAQKLL